MNKNKGRKHSSNAVAYYATSIIVLAWNVPMLLKNIFFGR